MVFDITLPIWRVGETMLFVARLARQYDDGDSETKILTIADMLASEGVSLIV